MVELDSYRDSGGINRFVFDDETKEIEAKRIP
jgi:hypothetical protein